MLTDPILNSYGIVFSFFIVPDPSGKLYIEAQGEAGTDEVKTTRAEFIDSSLTQVISPATTSGSDSPAGFRGNSAPTFPIGITQYAHRTKSHVLLDDAAHTGMFVFDPYVQHNLTKSVLCVPVINQAKVYITGKRKKEQNSTK